MEPVDTQAKQSPVAARPRLSWPLLARSAHTASLCSSAGLSYVPGMCGRYMLTSPVEALRQLFMFEQRPNLMPRYNIAPTQDVPIVRLTRDGAERGGETMTAHADMGSGQRGNRWRIAAWGTAALILLLPLVAMQFTDEVAWDAFDFAFMGALLGGVGLGLEQAVRKAGNAAYRTAAGAALAATFLLIWINGAVGIIGSEQEDANLLYGGVLAVALIGAIVARFRPAGMALAMSATALAQALVPVIALTFGPGSKASVWSPEVLVLTGFFAAMWLLSAWLFRKAAA